MIGAQTLRAVTDFSWSVLLVRKWDLEIPVFRISVSCYLEFSFSTTVLAAAEQSQ